MDDDFEGEREDQKAPDDEGDAPGAEEEEEEEAPEEQFNPDQAMGDNSDATDVNKVRELLL